jgi:hypothetical protein
LPANFAGTTILSPFGQKNTILSPTSRGSEVAAAACFRGMILVFSSDTSLGSVA